MKSRYLNAVLAMTTFTFVGSVGCGVDNTPATDQPAAAASKADDALSQDSLHFKGNIALTSQVFSMQEGNPNHPDTLKAGVTKGLTLFGPDAIGIKAYNSITYGTYSTTLELDLTTGVLARKVDSYFPEQVTLNPPDQGGDAADYVGLLIDMKAIIARVAEGNVRPSVGFNFPPVPELQVAIDYVQSLISKLSNGGTLGAQVNGRCYAYCPNGYADDPDYDGWGWANDQSCIVKGYIGDSKNRCFVGGSAVPASGSSGGTLRDGKCFAYCPNGNADDPDSDGWGFANNQSCIVKGASEDNGKPCAIGDSQGATSDTHFGRALALTSKVFEMRSGNPNHPDLWKSGVAKGLELLGADASGITAYHSTTYGLTKTRYELNLKDGVATRKVDSNSPPSVGQDTVNPPDQGGDLKTYAGIVRDMKDLVSTVAAGYVNTPFGFDYPPVPELQAAIDYLQFVLDKIGG